MSELHLRPSATSLQWVLPTDRREHKTPIPWGQPTASLPQTALVAEPLLTAVTNRAVPASPFTEHGAQHNPHQSSWSVPFTAVCLGTWDPCLKTALNCLANNTHRVHFPQQWGRMRELLCAWLPKALQALGFVPGKSCIHTGMSQNPFPKQFSLCHIHREREFSPKSKGSLEPDTLNLLKRKQ